MPRKSNGQSPEVVTDLIRRMRDSGRTKIDLARSAGVSERQVYYLMSGRNKTVGTDVLCALAATLGYDVKLARSKL
jgi:transcriptional regulator with XRE-family HTH domain